ncbi:MAG TPA: serine/threonine-protein kinase [Kofleriaceae bacterium]|nr:serine/threonine-protein kinase [Kofleriaceae bacterium]
MPAVPTRDPVVGQIIAGRYQALVRIGEGAVGVVYRARHVVLGRLVALKLVRAELAADPTWVQGLFAASAAASQIGDPHIGAVLDHGLTADNHPFLVAELLEGRSLRDELAREPVMAPARAARIVRQVSSALASAHAAGVLHRDLKPENIFLVDRAGAGAGADDFVRVVDFGPAEALFADDGQEARAGRVLGRPEYISPEQAAGRATDARSDLYSLGVVAYEMLAGRRPFAGASMLDMAVMHLRSAVPPLPDALPVALRDLVGRALEKDPASRFSSADEMVRACDDVLAALGAAPREPVVALRADGAGAGLPPDALRAPIETIPIDTHWLGADPDEAGLVHWTTRFPSAPAVHQTGTLEVGRTYLVETALETAGDQLAAAAARAALLPDGAAVRFGVHARGAGVRVAGQGAAFTSDASSGDVAFARGASAPFRFELRGDVPGPVWLKLGLYARNALIMRQPVALSLTRAGERPGRAEPLPPAAAVRAELVPARAANARIEITDDGALQIEIDPARERPRQPSLPLDQLADAAIRLRGRLVALSEAYRPDPGRPPFGIEDDERVMFEFARVGAELHQALFGLPDGRGGDGDLQRLARALAALGGADPRPRLQIVADHLPLPWAVVYDGASAGRPLARPSDVDPRRFWGARFQIDRAIGASLDGDVSPPLRAPVAVQSCIDPTLGAERRLDVVSRQRRQFADLRGVAPLQSIESREEFVRYLADDGAAPCDLLYFFCRARAAETVSPLFFRPTEPPRVQASLALDGAGEIDLKTMRELRLKPLPGRPLVFMNASTAAAGDQAFQSIFLGHFAGIWRARGFIGTDWVVPTEFADAFARQALRYFLDGRLAVADAFARASSDAFAQRNPFALIYALHVRPDLALAPEG